MGIFDDVFDTADSLTLGTLNRVTPKTVKKTVTLRPDEITEDDVKDDATAAALSALTGGILSNDD